jgi:hypothetical protein
MITAETGDLMLTASAGGLGPAIRWAEQTRGEEPSLWNHVGIVVKPGFILPCPQPTWMDPVNITPARVVESLWRTVEHEWYPAQKSGQRVCIMRPAGITSLQADRAVNRARRFVGAKYGWWKLATHLIDNKAFNGALVTRRLLQIDSRPICSYTVASAYAVAGIKTGNIPAQAQSPDTIWDFITTPGADWFCVGQGVVRKE